MKPLAGVAVLEFGGVGPGPFAAMVLANLGATVLRLVRPNDDSPLDLPGSGSVLRGRPAIAVDLTNRADRELVNRMLVHADVLIEGFRPGVMERLGFGPTEVWAVNPGLVYGRMTGYGQSGPLAAEVGHDINFLAVSGVLSALGRADERPLPAINLIGDYGGGGMLLALGVVAALFEARQTLRGQVIDAAMIDGITQLATVVFSFAGAGGWGPAGTNALDTGAHFYEVYTASDGKFVAVGAIEPRFYTELLDVLGVDADDFPQYDRARWPELKRKFAAIIATRSRDEWVAAAQGRDACLSPVLTLEEAPRHPHNVTREAFTYEQGWAMPVPAPRFSMDASRDDGQPELAPALRAFGLSDDDVKRLEGHS